MASLFLKEFRCVEETDEVGDDSPYFVIFVGNAGSPKHCEVKVIRRSEWDNDISSSSFRSVNQKISDGVGSSTVVLVGLMEEDNDPDITGEQLTKVRNWMTTLYDAYWVSGASSASQLADKLRPEFYRALNNYRSNDEIVGVVHQPISSTTGLQPLRHIYGDGGYYRVRLSTAA